MSTTLEHMSVWTLVSDASLLVKTVMLILVAASFISWYVIMQRAMTLRAAARQLQIFQARFNAESDFDRLAADASSRQPIGAEALFLSGYREFKQLHLQAGTPPEAMTEGAERAMYGVIQSEEERLEKGLSLLATIGSTSPYIGLFGTVWGIMNSFLGLSQVEQVSLSTVAPGIAEALIATAVGLFAAIPAVIAYNRFASRAETLMGRYYAFANRLQAIFHRRAHGAAAQPLTAAA
ncbi:Cell division and transport-associated protein TolQ (TC 2.C.1.2.1) [Pseudomonas duriflava]|uniref:Tol-Pal system protein TolQ n=1 Tax=Pseudomonas duriflava TaxID=459528 RepID=A0A562Q722_9PSED|nr:protein TolQ [Pseudomonas duriflava]TWI52537.1 Cell division and transport-associated protein TolQ (TC 2.C.1.2.1) [Pseudomonas duriflava]